MSVRDDALRILGRFQLEREAYQYATSNDPVHDWRAYLAARKGGHAIPPWVLEYFERSAQKHEPIFTRKYFKGDKVDPSEITDALGLTGQAGGGYGPVRQALENRRSGRAGEPAVGESVRASESLADDPQDPRLPSYPPLGPTDRLHDLYRSLSTLLGIRSFRPRRRPAD